MISMTLFVISSIFLSISAIAFKERVIKADILASIINISSILSILIIMIAKIGG